jgi:hypothetical protein
MQEWEIENTRKVYASVSLDEVCQMRDKYARHKSAAAQEMAALLKQIITERIAQEYESPSSWSRTAEPKPKLSPADQRKREEQRIERETQGGRFLPRPKEPASPYRNQTDYNLHRNGNAPPPVNYYACRNCNRFKRADDCTGECQTNPHFFSARRQTYAEWLESEKKRGE